MDEKIVIWLNQNFDSKENKPFLKELDKIKSLKVKCFKDVEESINYIKSIKFRETIIISGGRLYIPFITKFKDNLKEIYIIPKIIIFTKRKEKFLSKIIQYKDIIDDPFYNLGGIKTDFNEVKNFILNPTNFRAKKNNFCFEFLDSKENIEHLIFYQLLLDKIGMDKINSYTEILYNKFSQINSLIYLVNQIKNIPNIPIELLSKYYIRIFTAESPFYRDINNDLRENKIDIHLPYIKVLYDGVKKKSLSAYSPNKVYKGGRLLKSEIENIKNKINLGQKIFFSKTFLSFNANYEVAESFLLSRKSNDEIVNVFFILENNANLSNDLLTYSNTDNVSYFPAEKEILFFPFSSFEIKEIKKSEENKYEIRLLYLGKYKNIMEKNNIKPQLNDKDINLKTDQKENENIITKLKEENNKLNKENELLKKEILKKDNQIQNIKNKNFEITEINPGEKVLAVLFVTIGNQDIMNYAIVCKNTDLFVKLEEKLYDDFPQYKNYDTIFKINTRPVKRFKTIEENKIKNNDIISIFVAEE